MILIHTLTELFKELKNSRRRTEVLDIMQFYFIYRKSRIRILEHRLSKLTKMLCIQSFNANPRTVPYMRVTIHTDSLRVLSGPDWPISGLLPAARFACRMLLAPPPPPPAYSSALKMETVSYSDTSCSFRTTRY
jgi:hypothetical protein